MGIISESSFPYNLTTAFSRRLLPVPFSFACRLPFHCPLGCFCLLNIISRIFRYSFFSSFHQIHFACLAMNSPYVLLELNLLGEIKQSKDWLKGNGMLHKKGVVKTANSLGLGPAALVYTTANKEEQLDELIVTLNGAHLSWWKQEITAPDTLSLFVEAFNLENPAVNLQIPKKWTVYPPMVLFNHGTVELDHTGVSEDGKTKFYSQLLTKFFPNCTHIAVNAPIVELDVMRRPFNIIPVHGDFGPNPDARLFENPENVDFSSAFWCSVVQNGIKQIWAPRYTMFSRGNIKEKARVLKFKNTNGKVVVDMYAGIGYFTLSYLKQGAEVFCWELNPWSIEGLKRSLVANGFRYYVANGDFNKDQYEECVRDGVKAFIFHESNEQVLERFSQLGRKFQITHINMGLLPSSRGCWSNSCKLVSQYSIEKSCEFHVHENVQVTEIEQMGTKISEDLNRNGEMDSTGTLDAKTTHIEKVKTFAPDVWHVVYDVDVHT